MAPQRLHDGNGAETASSKLRCEIKTWHSRYKKDGSQEKVVVESSGHAEPPGEEYAVVVHRSFDERNRLQSTTLSINSPFILKALRDVVGSHPTVASDFSEPFDMESPFQMLFHHWDDLESYKSTLEDDGARMHVNVLFHFMSSDMGAEKKRMDAQTHSGFIDFSRLWAIYRPGSIVLTYSKTHPWLLRVDKTGYEENFKQGKWLEVHCLYTDFDGVSFGETRKVIKIFQKVDFPQESPAKILDLPVYPRAHSQEDDTLEKRLRARGDYFLSLNSVSVRHYDGLAEYLKDPPPTFFDPEQDDTWLVWLSHTETGRVVVDRKTFQEDHYQAEVARKSREALDAELCPPFVMGYSCNHKRWCRFFLSFLHEAAWKANAFDNLVLPSASKRLLQALVSSHEFPNDARHQAQQKGKGLVCLLHGPPGSGKTLTAECTAELTKRALFNTSMSELNQYNDAWFFEQRLTEVLRLATAWNAVVLLDEADVFLEARRDESPDAAQRNALVAVFLRHLEYFSGIVFLTTNRIHVFDAAMKSRVHLALGYSAPDLDSRRRIWRHNLLHTNHQDGRGFSIEDALEKFAPEPMNGREISNAVNTACTLARFSEGPLLLTHIDEVLGVRREFDLSMRLKASKIASSSEHGTVAPLPVRQGSILYEEPNDMA